MACRPWTGAPRQPSPESRPAPSRFVIRSAADSKYGCYSSISLPLASLGSAAGARGNGSGTAAAPLRCNRALNATRPFDFNASQRAITTLARERARSLAAICTAVGVVSAACIAMQASSAASLTPFNVAGISRGGGAHSSRLVSCGATPSRLDAKSCLESPASFAALSTAAARSRACP